MSRKLGNIGEDLAVDILKKEGYVILARNYQIRGGEIDIVAKDKGTIVFVEVKYRKDEGFGTNLDVITKSKIEKVLRAANVYLFENNLLESDWRLDVVAIDAETKLTKIFESVYIEGLA